MGQSMMFSYGSMLEKLKKEIMNPEEGVKGHLLDFFLEIKADELEKELREQNQQYREALDEIKKYEEEIQSECGKLAVGTMLGLPVQIGYEGCAYAYWQISKI